MCSINCTDEMDSGSLKWRQSRSATVPLSMQATALFVAIAPTHGFMIARPPAGKDIIKRPGAQGILNEASQ